jgi:hypothetical protein
LGGAPGLSTNLELDIAPRPAAPSVAAPPSAPIPPPVVTLPPAPIAVHGTWRWVVGAGLEVVFDVDPKTRVESLRLGPRLVARSAPGGKPDGHVFTLPAATGAPSPGAHQPRATSYRDAAPREARVVFDPTSGMARLFDGNVEVPPSAQPMRANVDAEVPDTLGADAEKRLKAAVGFLGFSAVANCVIGLVAIAGNFETLLKRGLGAGSVVVGLIYGTLAFFSARRSRLALGVAIALLAIDGLLMLVAGPGNGATGAVVVRGLIIASMVRAFRAFPMLPQPQTKTALSPVLAGRIAVVAASFGVIVLVWWTLIAPTQRRGNDKAQVMNAKDVPRKTTIDRSGLPTNASTPFMTLHFPNTYTALPTEHSKTSHSLILKDAANDARLSFIAVGDPSTLDVWTLNHLIQKHDPELATTVGGKFEDVERTDGTCLGESAAIVVTRIQTKTQSLRRWTCTFVHDGHAFRFGYLAAEGDTAAERELRAIVDATEVR